MSLAAELLVSVLKNPSAVPEIYPEETFAAELETRVKLISATITFMPNVMNDEVEFIVYSL